MNEPSATPPPRGELNAIVRKRILAGVYRPGEWIREAELQREFGLSNGPVREALQAAVAEGLAERAPFRGVRVIDLSEREVVELFEVRHALLSLAAERAAERTGADVQRSAAELKANLEAASSDASDIWLRGTFSNWVFELAGNARLREAYERPLLQSLLYVQVARTDSVIRGDLYAHLVAVIDAIAAGDPPAARAAVHALTQRTLHHIRSTAHLEKEPA